VYETVNNGTYQVAGATTQADYERLRHLLLATFAELDEVHLRTQNSPPSPRTPRCFRFGRITTRSCITSLSAGGR
jgi:glutathionyl-hydroquinone reductase